MQRPLLGQQGTAREEGEGGRMKTELGRGLRPRSDELGVGWVMCICMATGENEGDVSLEGIWPVGLRQRA